MTPHTDDQLDAIRVVAALSASPMSVVAVDGTLLLVNDAYCALVGRSRESLAGSGLRDITHPADYERDRDGLQALAAGQLDSYTIEKRYLRPDGSVVWGLITATPVRTGGTVTGSFGVVQDITASKHAEEALKTSEQHFRQVLDNAPIGMGLLDAEGRWVTVNQALCDLTGRQDSDLVGQRFSDITHPDDLGEDPAEWHRLLTGQVRSHTVRKRYVRPCGEVVWVRAHRSVLFDGDGQPRYVIGQVENITDEVRSEQELRDSEQRLRRLSESAEDFVVLRYRYGPEPGFEYVSPSVKQLTGYDAADFYADPFLTYRVIHPDDVKILEQVRDPDNALEGPQTLRAFHRDGRLLYTEQRSVPIYGSDGRRRGFDALVTDITARVEAEQLVESRERHFRSLVRNSSDMVFITDAEGVLLDATPSVQRILGYTPEELIGRSRFDFFHPEDLDAAIAKFATDAQRSGPPVASELRVRDAHGRWRWIECTATNLLDDPDVRGMVLNARDVTERRNLLAELQHRADIDALTGLVNWRRFMELVAERTGSGASEQPLGVLVLGLNRFGAVNDTLGYQYGDRLLQAVAERLKCWGGPEVVVARGGGKRFALLFDTIGHESLIETTTAVLSLFEKPFDVEGQPVQIDVTGGVALYPSDGGDAELLLRRAEVARRRARTTGASFARYAAGQVAPGAGQIRYLGQLREAIGGGQLLLHYQPKVDVATRLVHGVEALVRWQHPVEGWVQPMQFIPLAEESGLIRPLTQWVVTTALEQGQQWRRDGLHLPVAVNITSRNLQDHQFVDTLAVALAQHGAQPSDLSLEITERSVMTDPAAAASTCRRLSELGIRLSLDDFGTGQSALAYLVSLPIDEIKIDSAFVVALRDQPEARAIVRAIVALAADLGKDVIAEGVEDADTADLLLSLGCSRMQGFLYSRPVPVHAVAPWLADHDWTAPQPPGQCAGTS